MKATRSVIKLNTSSNSNEEIPLSLLSLSHSLLQQLVPNRQPQLLHSSRTIQDQRRLHPSFSSSKPQCIPQGKQDSTAQEERRLPNALARLDTAQRLPANALEETDVEFLRNVAEARDLVVPWSSGRELARLRPERFFHSEQTLALDERAFNLPIVDRWVYGSPDIHFDICAQDRVVAGQKVQFDFGACSALETLITNTP